MTPLLLAGMLVCSTAAPPPRFALVVGVKRAVDKNLATLKFADDDAAAFARLFERMGMYTVLVTRADEDTERLFPEIVGSTLPPTRDGLKQALGQLRQEIIAATARGEQPELYFTYAGHGSVQGGVGYITLEDGRLTGEDLEREIVGGLGASRTHLFIDACYAMFLAYHRGPGGDRRPAAGFSAMRGLLQNPRVGLLLSTSATNLTHEWEEFGAGVFSHLLRSGLYGAADADGNGWVDYEELGAFIARATESITNRRYRPSVYAKPPADSERLFWLGDGDTDRVIIGEPLAGRFLLEDGKGVRFADFHQAGTTTELLRPQSSAPLYLRNWQEQWEIEIPAAAGPVEVALLPRQARPMDSRGSAEQAMEELLALQFTSEAVQQYSHPNMQSLWSLEVPKDPIPTWRLGTGWGSIALGVIAAGMGAAFTYNGAEVRSQVAASASQLDVSLNNQLIRRFNRQSAVLYGVSVGALVTGISLLLWPTKAPVTGLDSAGSKALAGESTGASMGAYEGAIP